MLTIFKTSLQVVSCRDKAEGECEKNEFLLDVTPTLYKQLGKPRFTLRSPSAIMCEPRHGLVGVTLV